MDPRKITLTDANIKYGHIYVRSIRDLLPEDAIGGGNKAAAGVPITVVFEPGKTIKTDIAGDKMIFRDRSAVRDFLERSNLKGGQEIELEAQGDRRFVVRAAR